MSRLIVLSEGSRSRPLDFQLTALLERSCFVYDSATAGFGDFVSVHLNVLYKEDLLNGGVIRPFVGKFEDMSLKHRHR